MELSSLNFSDRDIASEWLLTSRLARKANQINAAYDAMMRAVSLNDPAATIENCRLLWKGGNYRKAIQNLKSALDDGTFASYAQPTVEESLNVTTIAAKKASTHNML